ncbi:VCBS repeat-containing protein [Streptomyces sp. NPDC002640]
MHRRTRTTLATVAAAAVTGGLLTFATATTATAVDGTVATQADFNNDGVGDVATSAAGAYVGGKKEAGQVVVAYGGGTGLTTTKRTVVSQDTSGVPGGAEAGDAFGGETAYADFDGDGYDDLAVGASGEDLGDDKDGGMVTILWGSASGITGKGAVQVNDPASSSHDRWGRTLAAGDFDGDGRQDLVVGTSKTKLYVLKGGISRSGTSGSRQTIQAPVWTEGPAYNITAGDVDGNGLTDLVVNGYTPEPEADNYHRNRNYLLLGTGSGLDQYSAQELRPGVITGIGDINKDGFGDIVSGFDLDPVENGVSEPNTAKGGKVWITYGSAYGVGTVQGITQDTSGVPGSGETNDMFGYELDLGDVNGDTYLDLAVGVAGENVDGVTDTGSVVVLYGTASGITGSGAQYIDQNTAGVPGSNEAYDSFGVDVKLDDVTGDGRADLVVGSLENDGNGGIVYVPSTNGKISGTGRSLSPTALGVSTTGYPMVGANFAD